MVKKLLLASFLFSALFQNAFAEPLDDEFNYYAGVSGGVTYNTADLALSSTSINIPTQFYGTAANSMALESIEPTGQLLIGAGWREDSFYIGLELLGQFLDGSYEEGSHTFHTSSTGIDLTNVNKADLSLDSFEVALDLKTGVFLSDVLLYTRVGVGVNELTLHQYNTLNLTMDSFGSGIFHSRSEESKTVFPFRLGLGLEHSFTEHLTLTADYIYIFYPDISAFSSLSDEDVTIPGVEVYLDTMNQVENVRRQVAMIGINYYL